MHTTRAVMDLLHSGRLARYRNIRYILAHGGGTVPYLSQRIVDGLHMRGTPTLGESSPDLRDPDASAEHLALLKRLYYDTAAPGDSHLAALQAFAGPPNIVFGTDGGWSNAIQTNTSIKALLSYEGFNDGDLLAIERSNATTLFPQLQTNG